MKTALVEAAKKHLFINWRSRSLASSGSGFARTAHGYFSTHGLGLPFILGPAVWLNGGAGARAVMLAVALAVPLLVYFVLRLEGCSPGRSSFFAVALGVSAPLLAHSTQIYPDLPAGAIALAVLWLVLRRARRATVEPSGVRYLVLALVAFMPWLHIRYLLPFAVLTGAIILLRREWSWSCAAFEAAPAVVSTVTLLAYNLYTFGQLSGSARAAGQELAPGWTAFSVFLGLNVDRFQGMFVQQPLLLIAVMGVMLLLRRARDVGLLAVALYVAFLVPTALHPNWYGGASLTGRFGLSAAIVLLLPAGVALAELARRFVTLASALAGGAICLNGWLYTRIWSNNLHLLSQPAGEPRSIYPSWLPVLGRSLPALNRVSWEGSFAPNYVVPVCLVALAIGCGLMVSTRKRLGTAISVLSVAAFLIPTVSAKPSESQDAVVLSTAGTGRVIGGVFDAEPGRDKPGLLALGPNFPMAARWDWSVTVRYSSSASPASTVGAVALSTGPTWCAVDLPGTSNHEGNVDLSWHNPEKLGKVLIVVTFLGRAPLRVSRVDVARGRGAPDSQRCRTRAPRGGAP